MKAWQKILTAGVLLTTLGLALTGCSSTRSKSTDKSSDDKKLVYVSMPTEAEERWVKDGNELKNQIKKAGYDVDLTYAQDKVEQQNSDIENAINKGADIIVVASKDGSAVGPAVEKAREAGVKVIAYDRLIMDTKAVDYYVTFQLEKTGVWEANYIIEKLGLDKGEKGPFNIELFTGSADDNNAKYFFKGAWDLLQPYFKEGVLVQKSWI
jgi:putative multiple sugar transport system substrate-binding protein